MKFIDSRRKLFLSYLRSEILENKYFVNEQDIRKYQLEKINTVLNYVQLNNEFYASFYKENGVAHDFKLDCLKDITFLPIFDKELFRQSSKENLISKTYKKSQLECHSTTGSTGTPTSVFLDVETAHFRGIVLNRIWNNLKNRIYLKELRLWRKKEPSGIDKIRTDAGLLYTLDILDTDTSIQNFNELILSQLDSIYQFNPNTIRGYVSALYTLGLVIDPTKFKNLFCVIASAESLPFALWNKLEELYKVPIINLYGGTEAPAIAVSSIDSKEMKISEDLYFVELVDKSGNYVKPGEPGRILITDLHNKAFPLITIW